jgi:hypothetical protein
MQIGQFASALVPLNKLRENNLHAEANYRQIAVCNAQLQQSAETVRILGRAAQLFGEQVVMGWMPDPLLDPVREDRAFQAFTDRIGGEEFRRWLENMAQNIATEQSGKPDSGPQLELLEPSLKNPSLLKPRQ